MARYKHFRGTHFPQNGKVEFGGVIFPNAYIAIKLLRYLDDTDIITGGMYYKKVWGFELNYGEVVTINRVGHLKTYSSMRAAKRCINILKARGII